MWYFFADLLDIKLLKGLCHKFSPQISFLKKQLHYHLIFRLKQFDFEFVEIFYPQKFWLGSVAADPAESDYATIQTLMSQTLWDAGHRWARLFGMLDTDESDSMWSWALMSQTLWDAGHQWVRLYEMLDTDESGSMGCPTPMSQTL